MAVEVFKNISTLRDGMRVECNARTHIMNLDEPAELGGTDTGKNPVETLLCALGACKCIVARSFAEAHNIDLQDLRIELEGDLDTDGFMGKNPDAKIGFSDIRSKVYIKSNSSKGDLEKFVQFMDKTCPAADTIKNPPEMSTELIIEE